MPGAWVLHAGTALDDGGALVAAGGRVLSVVGTGATLQNSLFAMQAEFRNEMRLVAQATGVASQADVHLNGHALQCRVTTEDPLNNFIPDYGRITAYRTATGNGIRLDGGTAYAGAVITRYYDSLLVKVTAWAQTPEAAIRRMDRALREFRVRGVSTNIDFVINLLKHPVFLSDGATTKFIDTTPELFDFSPRQDRATKILTSLADISVNGHPETKGRPAPAEAKLPFPPAPGRSRPRARGSFWSAKGRRAWWTGCPASSGCF